MTDRREDILARLVVIGAGVLGIVQCKRNVIDITELKRPAIIIFDGDEEAAEIQFRPGHGGMAPNLVTMTPSMNILLSDISENVGTALNNLRAELIYSVLSDGDLDAICGPNGHVRYTASATGMNAGRKIEGEIGVSFAITYPLIPSELVETA
jgi:hypothetical protein